MIRKVLVANRGEIACRVIRTCREMGLATVAVYSDADVNALHVELADEAVHIGGSPPAQSYLSIESIIGAALRTGADAIHPGYGFLAENPAFSYAAISENITFIGPPPGAMEAMGNKRASKILLQDVPFVPGYTGDDQSNEAFLNAVEEIGFPVMIKASLGGGGKGMRRVNNPDDFVDSLEAARREAQQAFGSDSLMLEKYVTEPRHIEIQVFGDHEGNIIAIGERECTIQRRHQKIIEETPSTALTAKLRRQMSEVAVNIATQIGYYSAGTVEFLIDDDKNFYFMEMNTRLQVEHPVTEMVTGFDLVRWQIQVARGVTLNELLPDEQTVETYYFQPKGHAIEARVYAENPANGFLPVIGDVLHWYTPNFIRSDTGIRSGDAISMHYDPMVAKIIGHGESRLEAIRRLDYGLSRIQLLGLRDNIDFLRRVLTHTDHLAGIITTDFIDENPDLLEDEREISAFALIGVALAKQSGVGHWRNNPNRPIQHTFVFKDELFDVLISPQHDQTAYQVQIGGQAFSVDVRRTDGNDLTISIDGHQQRVMTAQAPDDIWWIHTLQGTFYLKWVSPLPQPGTLAEADGSLHAPMTGQLIQLVVEEGQTVRKGDLLCILEAMKMEHRIEAPYDGTVQAIHFAEGNSVQGEAVLLEIEPDESNK